MHRQEKRKNNENNIEQVALLKTLNPNSNAKNIQRAYEVARKTFTSIVTENMWHPNTDDLKKKIATVEKTVQDIYEASYAGSNIETLIMLKILEWKIISLNEITLTENAATVIGEALDHLNSSQDYKITNNDDLFQKEVCDLLVYTSKLRTDEHDITEEIVAFKRLLQGYQISRNWPPTLCKLKLWHQFFFTSIANRQMLIETISAEDKRIFIETYEKTLAALQLAMKENPTDASLAIDYAMASRFAHDFESHMSPSRKKATPENPKFFLKYLRHSYELYSKYIKKSIRQLRKSDPASLHNNAEPITSLLIVIEQFRAIIGQFIDQTIQLQTLNIEQTDDFLVKLELELIDLDIELQETFNLFKLNDLFPVIESGNENYQNNDALKNLREKNDKRRQFHEQKIIEQLDTRTQTANKHAKSLGWDENVSEAFLRKKVSSRTENRIADKTQSSSSTKLRTESSDKLAQYISRAQYYSRNRRSNDAMETYEHAYKEAMQAGDIETQLLALEGQLLSHTRATLKKVKHLHSALYARSRSPKIILPAELEELSRLTQEIEIDHQKLIKLNTHYNKIISGIDLNSNKKENEWISFTQTYFGELLQEIDALLDNNKSLITSLNKEIMLRQRRYIFGLGIKAIKNSKDKTHTAEEINKIGDEEFKKIGIMKRRNNKAISIFTEEKRTFETIANRISIIKDKHNLLTQQNLSHDNLKVALTPEMKQLINELPQGTKLAFVGSCVIAEVRKKYKLKSIKPRDIDVLVAPQDINGLIQAGFTPSPYNAYLYQKFSPKKQDVMLAKTFGPDYIKEDAKRRDFTISAVYIEEGQFIDPNGTGIDDIINQRLRMIGNPTNRLHEDPTRALRAIYYMLLDFEPDSTLSEALKAMWVPDEHHRAHLLAKVKDHLRCVNRKQYVELLSKYGLLATLFDIKSKNIDMALRELEDLVGLNASTTQTKSNLFSRTDDLVKRNNDKDHNSDRVKALNLA